MVADKFSWLRLPRPTNPKLPSLILVGDSTVRNGRGDGVHGQWGWGDFLGPHFDTAKLNVVNRSVGGTGARSFGSAGYWDAAIVLVKPGDVVMIQFIAHALSDHLRDAALNPVCHLYRHGWG